jgi:sulfoxide reductase heme-binding subunit YedZ
MWIWYTARGAGLAALILLTATTCVGTVMSGRNRTSANPDGRVVVQYVHRFLATTALAVLGLHLVTILADSYAHVGVVGAAVPFTSAYRSLWVGLGSIAAYTMLLAAGTGWLRRRLAQSQRVAQVWRVLHGSAYAGWAFAMLHGLRSGTDAHFAWVRWIYLACLAAVAASVAVRAITATPRMARPASAVVR